MEARISTTWRNETVSLLKVIRTVFAGKLTSERVMPGLSLSKCSKTHIHELQ